MLRAMGCSNQPQTYPLPLLVPLPVDEVGLVNYRLGDLGTELLLFCSVSVQRGFQYPFQESISLFSIIRL